MMGLGDGARLLQPRLSPLTVPYGTRMEGELMAASEVARGLVAEPAHLGPANPPGGSGYRSILFDDAEPPRVAADPDYFVDLNLDQVVDQLTGEGRQEYELRPYFAVPLRTRELVTYRQEIVTDLEDEGLAGAVRTFAAGMRDVRHRLQVATSMRYAYQRDSWLLDGAAIYCDTVRDLAAALPQARLRAAGWLRLARYARDYVTSDAFHRLLDDVEGLQRRLAEVTYCVRVRGGDVGVSRPTGAADYSGQIAATFARFAQGDVAGRRFRLVRFPEMDRVETQILDRVAQLFPDTFAELASFPARHGDFLDAAIAGFDREVQFYLAYLELLAPLRSAGLPVCIPEITDGAGDLTVHDTFDLALAVKLVGDGSPVVCNDVDLIGRERILVVTGPNQGGKTTLARTVGQLHHLAALGLPVPGRSARLGLADRIFGSVTLR